jgi:hypothetical protein
MWTHSFAPKHSACCEFALLLEAQRTKAFRSSKNKQVMKLDGSAKNGDLVTRHTKMKHARCTIETIFAHVLIPYCIEMAECAVYILSSKHANEHVELYIVT